MIVETFISDERGCVTCGRGAGAVSLAIEKYEENGHFKNCGIG